MSANGTSTNGRIWRRAGFLAAAVALAACSASNDGKRGESSEASPNVPVASAHLPKDPRVEEWQKVIRKTPPPKDGCFRTSYPSTTWTELPCDPAPVGPASTPHPPRARTDARGPEAQSHGGRGSGVVPGQGGGPGSDWFLFESTPITQATGSFPFVQGATTPDSYSVQFNTNAFTLASTSDPVLADFCPVGSCQVWQQVLYSTTVARTGLYFQYWVLGGGDCAALEAFGGWNAGQSGAQCFINSNSVGGVPLVSISDLSTMSVTVAAGGSDVLTMTIEGSAYSASFPSELGLNQGSWNQVEYGVFGDLGGRGATLDQNGTTIVTHIEAQPYTSTSSCSLDNGATGASEGGATGEFNNLFDPTTVGSPPNPANCCLVLNHAESGITFTETDVTGQGCTVCGNLNQACCNGTNPNWCTPGNICEQGLCNACGGNDEPCCAGSKCTAPGVVCQQEACGAPNVLVASPSNLSVVAGDGTTGANSTTTNLEASGFWAGNGQTSPSLAFVVTGVPNGVPLPPAGQAPPGVSWAITNDINPPTVRFTATTDATVTAAAGQYKIQVFGTIGGYQNVPATTPVILNVSACQLLSCAAAGWTCGTFDNECGGTSQCGICLSGDSCVGGKCTPTCNKYCPPPEFLNPYACTCETCHCGTIIVDGHTLCAVCKP